MYCVSKGDCKRMGTPFFLLVTTMSVASLSKFQFSSMVLKARLHYLASAGMLLPSVHVRAWDALWFLETFGLEFINHKTRSSFLETHPFSFDLANYRVSVMYKDVQIWDTEQSWWDVLPLLKLQLKREKFT